MPGSNGARLPRHGDRGYFHPGASPSGARILALGNTGESRNHGLIGPVFIELNCQNYPEALDCRRNDERTTL